MTEEAGLLKAIARTPHEDAERLIYADWLYEHGDANRAELIRLQCSLERGLDWTTALPPNPARLEALRNREQELIKEMLILKEGERPGVRELTPEIARIVANDPQRITFRRGMVENLNLFGSPITTLPHDLHVGSNLNLARTPITALPPGLHVGGNLFLTGTRIAADAARQILIMPNLSLQAKITGLQTAGFLALADEVCRQPDGKAGPRTPLRP